MARQIIVLDKLPDTGDSMNRFRYALWPVVPAVRQSYYADANKKSMVTVGPDAITPTELLALQAGQFVEIVDVCGYPKATAISDIQADLIARFNAAQANLNSDNRYVRFGTSWDGATWHAVTVA